MTPLEFALIIGLASLAAWLAFAVISARSRSRVDVSPAGGTPAGLDIPEPFPRLRGPDLSDVSRRKFLLRAMGLAILAGLGQFALASVDFLFPRLRGGFGSKVVVGDAEEIRDEISASREPQFVPEGRFFISIFEGELAEAERIRTYKAANVTQTGLMALYRKCPHLGCSVPWCPPAKWFECPCHGSKYSVNGEYRDGPAPRSLDQFRVEIVGGKVVVDTATVIQGAPRGTVTSQLQPEGAHCVTIREG